MSRHIFDHSGECESCGDFHRLNDEELCSYCVADEDLEDDDDDDDE